MNAVVMTVFNRPEEMLRRTFKGLKDNGLSETRVIVVDDASTYGYHALKREFPLFEWHSVDTKAARPETYQVDGWNLEVYAMNYGIEVAFSRKAKNIFIMSSDVVVPPDAIREGLKQIEKGRVFVSSIVDEKTGEEYCGRERIYPMHWFMGIEAGLLRHIDGFDEEFLRGNAWADNDFAGRLFLEAGEFFISTKIKSVHQSHPNSGYADDGKGWDRNHKYIRKKWGCDVAPLIHNRFPLWYGARYEKDGIVLHSPSREVETP